MRTRQTPREPLSGWVFGWPPQGMRDFAEVTHRLAEALGNGTGVRGLSVDRRGCGVAAHLYTTSAEYVRAVAAAFGWELYEPDAGYANTWGRLGGVAVDVTWIVPAGGQSTEAAAG